MSGDNSAYATLGLRPGAGRGEVDEAYRRLIKRYHPDRMGGDSSRAAEINRAYSQIRRNPGQPAQPRRPVPVPVLPRAQPRRRTAAWLFASVVLVAGALAVASELPTRGSGRTGLANPFQWSSQTSRPAPDDRPVESTEATLVTTFEEPLQSAVIDRAIADAVKFHAIDAAASAEYSRACHNSLRDEPSLTWFDSCAAFDEATVTLTAADLYSDAGPFSPTAVMARHMGAARLLSDDMLAADSRLHQIRSRVELALVPRLDEAAAFRP